MNFLGKFSKIRQIFPYNLFSFESQTERVLEIFIDFQILLRLYKCTAHLQKTREISGLPKDSGADSHYCTSGQHSYTLCPLAAIILEFEKSHFKYHAGNQSFWFSLQHCLFTFLITSLQLPSWLFQFITSYTTHSDLIGTVWIKWIQISTWYVKCI